MAGGDALRALFLYWGRRGALTPFTLALANAALADPDLLPIVSVSRQNEAFDDFSFLGDRLMAVDTFSSGHGALTSAWRIPSLRRRLRERIARDRIEAVFVLMSHVWTPLVASAIRDAGARYIPVVHDAVRHPGDPTSAVLAWQLRDLDHATSVVTLSDSVAKDLVLRRPEIAARVVTLFHPDLRPSSPVEWSPSPDGRLRLLFLGRIMPYKGLGLLVASLKRLAGDGVKVGLSVLGEGDLGDNRARLDALGARIANRWLSDAEIAEALASHDVVALSHTEASQSGVAALAFGAGLPVVATPVGGLATQVTHGVDGLLADAPDPDSFATAIRLLVDDPTLLPRLRNGVADSRDRRSMSRFVRDLAKLGRLDPEKTGDPTRIGG